MKYFFIILSLLFYSPLARAFSDDICANVLQGNVSCAPNPDFADMDICVGTSYQSSLYQLGIQHYGQIVTKALSGQPIDTLYVPTCVGIVNKTYAGDASARWAYSSGATSVDENLTIEISSPAMSGGNIVLSNQSDANYTLQATPQYCSCGNYNAGGANSCGINLVSMPAGSSPSYPYYGDGSSNNSALTPCGGTNGTGIPHGYSAGFFVLPLTTPSGQIPPAGTYNSTFVVDVTAGSPFGKR